MPFVELKRRTERKKNDKRLDEPFEVPLSRQAVPLLRELHKITGHSRFLFPGRGKSRTISKNTLNAALQALGYAGVHCAHGFRSSASTLRNKERIDGRRRFEREPIEVQLDHVGDSTRAIYDRESLAGEGGADAALGRQDRPVADEQRRGHQGRVTERPSPRRRWRPCCRNALGSGRGRPPRREAVLPPADRPTAPPLVNSSEGRSAPASIFPKFCRKIPGPASRLISIY